MKKKLLIIITLYNEADNIKLLVRDINESLTDTFDLELVLVDAHSLDGTKQIITELAKENKIISLVLHENNYGQSAAIYSGVKAADYDLKGGSWIIIRKCNPKAEIIKHAD